MAVTTSRFTNPLDCRWVLFRKRSDFRRPTNRTEALCVRLPDAPRVVTEKDCVECKDWESGYEPDSRAAQAEGELFGPSIAPDALRLREEFHALPGLTLTPPQAARLLSVRLPEAAKMLGALKEEGFLGCSGSGIYFRPRPNTW